MTALPAPTAFDVGQWPELDQRLKATVATLNSGGAPWACRHVVLDGFPPLVCIHHPALGLMCLRCSQNHARHHDEADEHTCDACGRQVGLICAVVMSTYAPLVQLRDPKGWRRAYSGEVKILGVGVCAACRDQIKAGARLDASGPS